MPQAIPFIALAVTAAGTGVAVASSLDQAAAAEKAADFNEKVAANNATAAMQQAQFEADRVRKRNLIILGRAKSLTAKAGILDTGSAENLFWDSAVQGELDAMVALHSGQSQSNYHLSAGRLARMEGSATANAARMRAGGTLLTGIGSAADQASRTQWAGPRTVTGPGGTTFTRGEGNGGTAYFGRWPRIED